MTNSEAQELVKKYNSGHCTPEEKAMLHAWYAKQAEDNQVSLSDEEIGSTLDRVWSGLPVQEPVRNNFYGWHIAAAILLFISAGLYLFNPEKKSVPQVSKTRHIIVPGGNNAVLTLGDGSKIVLDNAKNGVLAKQGSISIQKTADGQLIYNLQNMKSTGSEIAYNTITTPKGGQYQIVLPDGSRVWLNAASELRFPAMFSGRERRVQLNGEAYFEVSKNKNMPFMVSAGTQTVEVLGTHFNISAYRDEDLVKTTLIEGSVSVSNASSKVVLQPGQQSRVGSKAGNFDIVNANVEEVIAWKNGYFLFDDEELRSIMRKISRWYNVEVVYEGDPDGLYFGGMVSRSKNISSVLKIMESTQNVKFKVEGRRIIVMP